MLTASCAAPARTGAQRSATLPGPSASPDASPSPVPIPPIPEGTYVTDVSAADARRFHVQQQDVDENTGHFRLTLRNGHWRLVQSGHPVNNPITEGAYYGSGHSFVLQFFSPDMGKDFCRWKFDPKTRTLTITIVRVEPAITDAVDAETALAVDRAIFQSHPWKKTA